MTERRQPYVEESTTLWCIFMPPKNKNLSFWTRRSKLQWHQILNPDKLLSIYSYLLSYAHANLNSSCYHSLLSSMFSLLSLSSKLLKVSTFMVHFFIFFSHHQTGLVIVLDKIYILTNIKLKINNMKLILNSLLASTQSTM